MQRICASLAERGGYRVVLVGRELRESKPLIEQPFEQRRLRCWARRGKLFYLEFNLRLLIFLLFRRMDAICAVDLDTIMPAWLGARLGRRRFLYDAHELFTEVPEVVERPKTQRIWQRVERFAVPRVDAAYTVCESLKNYFEEKYKIPFGVVRNLPFAQVESAEMRRTWSAQNYDNQPFILLYQGALNMGRGLEEILEALPLLPDFVHLWLAGEGDESANLRAKAAKLALGERVKFWGYVQPRDLRGLTLQCHAGLNLLQNKGLNYYYSLANKFFDYAQALRPSLNMAFPEYIKLTQEYGVGLLLPDLQPTTIVKAVGELLEASTYARLQSACEKARADWTWEREEERLLEIYARVFGAG